ncbi:MAG: hypothetical protein L0338_06175 [Acidobacteria bacterium]|nr:hypothetical protein [Acidobacteriota bacterium]
MRMRDLTLLAITVAVSMLVLGSIAQAADNQAGTWKLNVAKSKYSPGPAPKEGTLTIESQADGLKFTIHGTDAEGKAVHFEMSPKYDGKDYPMTGNPDADMISMKKINDHTIETVSKKGGKPMLTVRSVVSKDGKTRTSTQKGTNAKGQKVSNTIVYDKQ